MTSLVRNPFVSPEIIPSMLLRPHTRFMQQRQVTLESDLIGGWPRDRGA
ncbi:MAG: hypothetical protein V3Q69_11390 [Burkholderia sp.]